MIATKSLLGKISPVISVQLPVWGGLCACPVHTSRTFSGSVERFLGFDFIVFRLAVLEHTHLGGAVLLQQHGADGLLPVMHCQEQSMNRLRFRNKASVK